MRAAECIGIHEYKAVKYLTECLLIDKLGQGHCIVKETFVEAT